MTKNLVAQVSTAKGEFELVEREIPEPGVGEVRIKVGACGICYSDHLAKDGLQDAYARMESGDAQFRVVLTM